ncbi:hypothetical protein Lalb_Chr02g0153491 [Lupinus albus]|uniref:Uncharacterized protein n=1 Tax=Lupinus albus TaxID=3870 RepID=A0A6A4R292_LUPAL|nr:hypothetical protein Lalb_Chr02g0153491 [Lupinus albus]
MINSNVREGKLNDALFGLVDLRSLLEFIGRALHPTIEIPFVSSG